MRYSNNSVNATVGLMFLTLVSKILGFVREMVISYMYGASAMSDAYSLANSVTVLIITGIAAGIMTAYIPSAMELEGQRERDAFTSNLINVISVVSGVIAVLCIIFAEPIVSFLGMGFTETTKGYTIILFRFVMLAAVSIFIIYIMSGYLNTKQNFSYSGIQLILTNLIIIIAVLCSEYNPMQLGIGYYIAYLIPFVLGFGLCKKYKFEYSFHLSFRDARVKNIFILSLIAFVGTNVVKFDVMVDRIFASSLQEGTVAAINYAFTLTSIFPEVFIMSIITVGYPKLAEWFANNNQNQISTYVNNMLVNTCVILLPITVLFLEMGTWIVQILFQRGAFNESDTLLTVGILNSYTYGMLGMGISMVLCKVFFAWKKEWVPAVCLAIGIVVNVVFNVLFSRSGVNAIAITTSISVSICAIMMLIMLIIMFKEIKIYSLFKSCIKILFAILISKNIISFGMGLCDSYQSEGAIIKLLILMAIATIALMVYVLLLYMLNIEGVRTYWLDLRKKIKK